MENTKFSVKKYESINSLEWDQFIDSAKNATFLFKRDFMEYHQDRFEDYSIMIYKKNKLYAVLPANRSGTVLYSHQGLTYGGLISNSPNTATIEMLLDALIDFLKTQSFKEMYLKIAPQFQQETYHSALEYFLFQKGGDLIRRDLNFIVDLSKKFKINKSKRKKLNSADVQSLDIDLSDDLKPFWEEVLVPILVETYGVKPVHSLKEIQLLKDRFPNNILQYNVFDNGEIVAGMTLFVNNGVVKSQYGAATKKGQSLRALDFLYISLFEKYKEEGFHYFDMGTTTVDGGSNYNTGLTRYKEEFGAYAVNMDHFNLSLL